MKGDSGRVTTFDAADGHFSTQLHPGHGEDGACVGAGQREDVLFIVLQETQDSWEEEGEEEMYDWRYCQEINVIKTQIWLDNDAALSSADFTAVAHLCLQA